MKTKFNQNLLAAALMGMIAFGSGCATKNDAVAQAEKTEKNAPGIAETRASPSKASLRPAHRDELRGDV